MRGLRNDVKRVTVLAVELEGELDLHWGTDRA